MERSFGAVVRQLDAPWPRRNGQRRPHRRRLILAVCPLSMVLMMRAMGSMGSCKKSNGDGDEVDALEGEIAELRQQQADASSDGLRGRG